MRSLVREPAVAGRFYPGKPEPLRADVESYLSPREVPEPAVACMVPHAGYVYSGHVAGAVFAQLAIPSTCIVLCPNHTGMGVPFSIMSEGEWRTPLGSVAVDEPLAAALKESCSLLQEDTLAHEAEHAIEVELPFLQTLRADVKIVPITIGTQDYDALQELGLAMADVIRSHDVLLIASSDMNHYENDDVTRVKDDKAIVPILQLNAEELYRVAKTEHVSMCGLGPAVSTLTAAQQLGATSAKLVRYATSGDIFGDRDRVVGYAGVIVR